MTTKKNETVSGWAPAAAPVADQLRANTELIVQINRIVLQAAQSMASRQSAVITEAVSDVTTLLRAGMLNSNDPAETTRAYSAFVQAMMQRTMSQVTLSIETVAEMSASALDLAQRRLPNGAPVEPRAADIASLPNAVPKKV